MKKPWGLLKEPFLHGGQIRLQEFRKDALSWSWPITILAFPTILYGLSRSKMIESVETLRIAGIELTKYRPALISNNDHNIQYVIWVIAIVIGFSSYYRYINQRSIPTFFSRSKFFTFSRNIIFNIPITYITINIIVIWCDFSFAISSMFLDNTINYPIFYPDLMYGLKPLYNLVISFSFSILSLSFLPILIFSREREQKYRWMYLWLLYGGIGFVIILGVFIIFLFDNRLSIIKANALNNLFLIIGQFSILDSTKTSSMNLEVVFQQFNIIKELPGGFPLPLWLSSLVGLRSVVFLYELLIFLSPKGLQKPILEFVKEKILKLIE